MKHKFKAWDHVEWNSEAGYARGTIQKIVTSAVKFKNYTARASKEEPQYLIKSAKTDPSGHKGSALKKLKNEHAENKKTADCLEKSTPKEELAPRVMTIGHSTHTLEEFISILQAHGATCIVDVRTVPRSRHNPQFNKDSLPKSLEKAELGYVHMPGLGGLRHAKRDSVNVGWRNDSFRGYADYMQTPEFACSLEELIRLANQDRIVLMCAEAVPWRCHRSLIADALLVRGICTADIMDATRLQVHTLTTFAKVCDTTITYPTETLESAQQKPLGKRSWPQSVAKSTPKDG
jgi:hypothetical protein